VLKLINKYYIIILLGCDNVNKLNKKGFTLVELLATVVLLGIISAIAMVSIDAILDDSQVRECDSILLSIKSATKEYISDNRFELNSKTGNVDVTELINQGYLTAMLTDPFNNVEIKNPVIQVDYQLNDDYTYQSAVIKKGSKTITCDKKQVKDDSDNYVLFPG